MTAKETPAERHDRLAELRLAAEADIDRLIRESGESANAYLKKHDSGATAREQGFSLTGSLPGESKVGREVVHLPAWENVGASVAELSVGEVDEERRGEGALATERHGNDVAVNLPRKSLDPRSMMNGWSPEAQAAYFVGKRHSGVWDDQAYKRFIDRQKKKLPYPIPCAVCSEVFQPERKSAKYCSEACKQREKRQRAKRSRETTR